MAGLPWFKLAGDFFAHPKTLELQAELSDPCADVYVVRMWAYVSRVAASGRLSGRNVVSVLERAVGWQGEPGRLVAALLSVGFLEQEPEALVVHDWATEQGAHVAKVERDRARLPAHKRTAHTDALPARESRGNVAESREGPDMERERETKRENTASQALTAPPVDDIPDATEHAEAVEERPALVLVSQPAGKPPRKQPPGEALYVRLEARRKEACERDGLPFVGSRWAFSRQNKELGPLARAEQEEPKGETWTRFVGAWVAFLEDTEVAGKRDEPYALDFFWRFRSRYEGRALREATT